MAAFATLVIPPQDVVDGFDWDLFFCRLCVCNLRQILSSSLSVMSSSLPMSSPAFSVVAVVVVVDIVNVVVVVVVVVVDDDDVVVVVILAGGVSTIVPSLSTTPSIQFQRRGENGAINA